MYTGSQLCSWAEELGSATGIKDHRNADRNHWAQIKHKWTEERTSVVKSKNLDVATFTECLIVLVVAAIITTPSDIWIQDTVYVVFPHGTNLRSVLSHRNSMEFCSSLQ